MNPIREIHRGVRLWAGIAGVCLLAAAPLAAQQPKPRSEFKARYDYVMSVRFSPDGKTLAAAGANRTLT